MSDRLHGSVSNHGTAPEKFGFDGNTSAGSFAGDDLAAWSEIGQKADSLPSLRDAFEASFRRPAGTQSMAAIDALTEGEAAPVGDTRAYPFRTIAFLHITAADGSGWRGTAFLVSPRTLITAGHNVYLHDHGGWAKSIDLYPGRNATGSPFGKHTSVKFNSVRGWIEGRDAGYDYGAIIVEQEIGSSLGFFGIHAPSDGELDTLQLDLAG